MGEKERYYRIINNVWDFIKTHMEQNQDWNKFCEDMKQLVFSVEKEDQTMLRAMLVAFENDIAERGNNG